MTADWSGQVAVTGTGLVTPVGLRADAAIAAMRAGVSRLGELPYLDIEVDEGEFAPIIGAEVPDIPAGRQGVARLVRLLEPSLVEAVEDAVIESGTEVEVFLGTAGDRPGDRILSQNEPLQAGLIKALPKGLRIKKISLVRAGRAAALQALRTAALSISAGTTQVAIVGGVDSWILPRSLAWLQAQKRLREYPRKTGILPGEAAGFLVVESMEHAQSRGADVRALVSRASGRHEQSTYGEPCNALALSESLRSVGQSISEPRALVISDFNGERYRALEWINAIPKGMWYYRTLRHWHPAEYIGDTGAASGVISLAWATAALKKDYARTGNVLVWGASDEGAREAVMVSAAAGGV